MFRYYNASAKSNQAVQAPPIVVEMTLAERFHWSILDIEETPYKKIQELFVALTQREVYTEDSNRISMEKKNAGQKQPPKPPAAVRRR